MDLTLYSENGAFCTTSGFYVLIQSYAMLSVVSFECDLFAELAVAKRAREISILSIFIT